MTHDFSDYPSKAMSFFPGEVRIFRHNLFFLIRYSMFFLNILGISEWNIAAPDNKFICEGGGIVFIFFVLLLFLFSMNFFLSLRSLVSSDVHL